GVLEKAPASDGSFNATVDAAVGETIQLQLFPADATDETPAIATTAVALFGPSTSAIENGGASAFAGSAASSPGGNGFTTVVLPADSLVPNTTLVLANITAGASAFGVSATDGSLSITVEAQSGDQLELFAVDLAMSNGGGPSVTLIVP
ncbi:MAG: hypothetical protein AAFQ82_27165, partial [Myxococcota bacterium]